MIIYFVTSEHYYSKMLRTAEGSTMTHVGLGFFGGKGITVDCTKPFSKVYHINHWKTKYDMVSQIHVPLTPDEENEAYNRVIGQCLLKPYDWGAYAFGWLEILKFYLTGRATSDVNKWATEHGLLCTEVLAPVVDILKKHDLDLTGVQLSAKTPQMVYDLIVSQGW